MPRSAAAADQARRALQERLADRVGESSIVDAQIVLTEVLGPWVVGHSRTSREIEVEVVLEATRLCIAIANLGARLVRAATADELRLSVISGVASEWGIRGRRDPVFWFELVPPAGTESFLRSGEADPELPEPAS